MDSHLCKISDWSKCAGHLDMLIATIRDDLCPLVKTRGGAPHTISREFSCYVDYLGALYTGWVESNKSRERFTSYLREVLRNVNEDYSQHADLIREMYRNGPVHEFDPKIVFNRNGDTCGWLESVGHSPGYHDFGQGNKVQVFRLKIVADPLRPKVYYLPVFTSDLLGELIKSIELFKLGVGDSTARVLSWNKAVGVLTHPVRFDGFSPPKISV